MTLLVLDLESNVATNANNTQGLDTLGLLNALYVGSSSALNVVDSLVLTLPQALTPHDEHKWYAAYQHLYQEHGLRGYAWQTALPGHGFPTFSTFVAVGLTRLHQPNETTGPQV